MPQLTEYYKIILRFAGLYVGVGDDELARRQSRPSRP